MKQERNKGGKNALPSGRNGGKTCSNSREGVATVSRTWIFRRERCRDHAGDRAHAWAVLQPLRFQGGVDGRGRAARVGGGARGARGNAALGKRQARLRVELPLRCAARLSGGRMPSRDA